jgi:hypothetical protein
LPVPSPDLEKWIALQEALLAIIPSAGEEKSSCENETRITFRKSDIYRGVRQKDSKAIVVMLVVMLVSLNVNRRNEEDGYSPSIYKNRRRLTPWRGG